MSDELKLCPFCGGPSTGTLMAEFLCGCIDRNCPGYGPFGDARWNTRAITPDVESFARACVAEWAFNADVKSIDDAIAVVKARRGGKL